MASEGSDQRVTLDSIFMAYPTTARKILKHIPRHLRFDIAAVNWTFYEAVCSMDKLKHSMVIKGNQEDAKVNEYLIETILNSRREFDEIFVVRVRLGGEDLQRLIRVAEKYGNSIRKLTVGVCFLNFRNANHCRLFSQFLENLPNLEEWNLISDVGTSTAEHHNLRPAHIQPVLRQLKKFSAEGLFAGTKAPIYSRFIASNTIQELNIVALEAVDFTDFMLRQSNVKSLKITLFEGDFLNQSRLYRRMQLEEVNVRRFNEVFAQELARDHPTLKKLQLNGLAEWNEMTVQTLLHHAEHLQVLDVVMTDNNCVHLLGVVNLKNLKEVKVETRSFSFSNYAVFMDFSRLKIPSVTKLELELSWQSTDPFDFEQALENFAEHWENIDELKYSGQSSRSEHSRLDIEQLMLNFSKLKSISARNPFLTAGNLHYGNVESMELFEIQGAQLDAMLQACPNLTKLNISNVEIDQMEGTLLTLVQLIAAHPRLNDLSMKLRASSLPSNELLTGIRDMCRGLPTFKIALQLASGEVAERIVTSLQSANDFSIMWRTMELLDEFSLVLKNFKY